MRYDISEANHLRIRKDIHEPEGFCIQQYKIRALEYWRIGVLEKVIGPVSIYIHHTTTPMLQTMIEP
jgi:hypothetical protein